MASILVIGRSSLLIRQFNRQSCLSVKPTRCIRENIFMNMRRFIAAIAVISVLTWLLARKNAEAWIHGSTSGGGVNEIVDQNGLFIVDQNGNKITD